MTRQEIHELVFDEFICGCGDPVAALDLLRSVLLAIRNRHDCENDGDWEKYSKELDNLIGMDQRPALAWSYLYFLDSAGLLEHGGNCSGSWLDEKGHQVLDALLQYDSESIIENEEPVLDAEVINA